MCWQHSSSRLSLGVLWGPLNYRKHFQFLVVEESSGVCDALPGSFKVENYVLCCMITPSPVPLQCFQTRTQAQGRLSLLRSDLICRSGDSCPSHGLSSIRLWGWGELLCLGFGKACGVQQQPSQSCPPWPLGQGLKRGTKQGSKPEECMCSSQRWLPGESTGVEGAVYQST